MLVRVNSTDVTTYFQLRLAADGADATGLTIADFDLQYVRSGATPAAKVDAVALAAADTAHTDNRMIEVDATDTPGLYRVDWPDAAFASGVREVVLTVKHASIFTESLRVQLVAVDLTDTVRFGLTALPNAAAEAAGGLYTRGTGAGQINQDANGRVDTRTAAMAADVVTAAAVANGAIDAATFAGDVDAEILSYIVDDATRIDASALNTAAVTTIPAILVDTGTTLDGKIDAIGVIVADILVDTGTTLPGLISAIAGYNLLEQIVDGDITVLQYMRADLATAVGESDRPSSGTRRYKSPAGVTRVVATVSNGDRSDVELTLS